MTFDEFKSIVLEESKKYGKVPKRIIDKSEKIKELADVILKKYPKFQTVRNMVSAIIKDKYLIKCKYCNEYLTYEKCIRYHDTYTCGKDSCRTKGIKETNMKKYGVSMYMNSSEALEKRRKNGWKAWNSLVDRKHNTKFINHYNKIKKRLDENHLSGINSIDEYFGILDEKTKRAIKYNFTCNICGCKFSHMLHSVDFPYCRVCHPVPAKSCIVINDNGAPVTARVSDKESELYDFCKSICPDAIRNKRNLINDNSELDIFIPSLNIGIEFNGIYWHSEEYKPQMYHKDKTEKYLKNGIQIIHVFEDEWINKKQIVKARLRHILNKTKYHIGARKCSVKQIDSKLAKRFLEKYHLQGNVKSNINLGLYYRNRLVAVMNFGKPRFSKKYDYELLRYATISSFNIVGGASKLFKHFIKKYKGKIITYADRRWSVGNLYNNLGFKQIKISKPNYFYVIKQKRETRYKFQKSMLKNKLEKFYPDLTEVENMKLNGYRRIWDAGNIVFEYDNA